MSNTPIVAVGIDGSEQAFAAAKWAVDVAARRHVPLEVIHSWSIPLPPVGLGPAPVGLSDDHIREAAQSVLDDATTRLNASAPDVVITGTLYPGTPATALLEAAERSSLVVVGSSGLDRVTEFILGSVTQQVVAHAACPVAVVPMNESNEPGEGSWSVSTAHSSRWTPLELRSKRHLSGVLGSPCCMYGMRPATTWRESWFLTPFCSRRRILKNYARWQRRSPDWAKSIPTFT
jgi:nucleotide-binding universal stress UspA family protein